MFLSTFFLTFLIFGNSFSTSHKGKKVSKTSSDFDRKSLNYPMALRKKVKGKVQIVKPNHPQKRSKAPVKVVPILLVPVQEAKPTKWTFELLHKQKRYNTHYMSEYKKMIKSLLKNTENIDPLFNNRQMLTLPKEPKTVKSIKLIKKFYLPICSPEKEKNWNKIKVLQLEEMNSVTLKENSVTGVKVVEKSMNVRKHYDKEMEFFRYANHGSNKYFPAFICGSKPNKYKRGYSIITDFVDGDKSHVMAASASPYQLKHMVAQFFNSIIELHRTGFIHCDLTPANVMVTKNYQVVLIDFGMAMPVGQANGYRGSKYIRAPELHEMCPGKIDVAIDWWAFGTTVSIWYYYHYNPEALLDKDHTYKFTPMRLHGKQFKHFEFPDQFPTSLRKFLSLFLTIDPDFRTFSTVRLQNLIRSHEFFEGFDWSTADKS